MVNLLHKLTSAILLSVGFVGVGLGSSQAYYLEMTGTVTGQDAGQVLLGAPSLATAMPVQLLLYTSPTPVIELIVQNKPALSYTFFINQPASLTLDQADPTKLSFAMSFGNAGYQTASEYFQSSGSFPTSASSDMASIVAGSASTTTFRRDDLVADATAESVVVDPFSVAFSAVSASQHQQSNFFLTVTGLRFADVGLIGPPVVPLPAAAPMFGAALVAFGLVGRGMKRRSAATI